MHTIIRPDRRQFLTWTASAAAAMPLIGRARPAHASTDDGAIKVAFAPETVAENRGLFPNACLAGDMKPDSALLAAYFADRRPKTLLVWRFTDRPGTIALVKEQAVAPGPFGYAKTPMSGLLAGTWYHYAYFDGTAARSMIGSFRTALAPDSLEPLTVAISACNGGYYQPGTEPGQVFSYPALEATAREYYDMFIHLGDQAYMDRVFAAGGARELYLEAWKAYLGSDGMRQCYAAAGMYSTWDDHEVSDNHSVDPWSGRTDDIRRIANAKSAYFRVMPIDADAPSDRLWRSFRWGRTAEIILLDCRYERDRPSTDRYIGREQMEFLKTRLAASPCHFKVVANSVPITNMPWMFDFMSYDRWEGYGDARRELFDHINDERIDNVWFLSGDLHVNFVSRLEPSGSDRASRAREIAVTGGNTALGVRGRQFSYSRTAPRACLLTFDPFADEVRVEFRSPDGRIDYASQLRHD